jgi:hypothetical protein
VDKGKSNRSVWVWETAGAIFGFAGAILAALFGGLLTIGAWLSGTQTSLWLQRLGDGLLLAVIPLLIFAGYCLDRMEHER